jgi:hypothetical protein
LEAFARQPASTFHLETAGDGMLPAAVLAALAYADLFDYPLTLDELARYQIGSLLSQEQIAGLLAGDPGLKSAVTEERGYYSLAIRQSNLAATRLARERRSRRLWRRAHLYSRWISRLPYVRMVAVTGALAVNNVGSLPDIDLMVVARHGRVWLCRRALILCVRVARLFHDDLCPNYIVSENTLDLDQRDFFTAHELAQMVPLYGAGVYRRMIQDNNWTRRYLPCAFGPVVGPLPSNNPRPHVHSSVEKLLDLTTFDRLEAWEMRRLRAKLQPLLGENAEVMCTQTQCKGHTGLNRQRVMLRFRNRLRDLDLIGRVPQVVLQDFILLPEDK